MRAASVPVKLKVRSPISFTDVALFTPDQSSKKCKTRTKDQRRDDESRVDTALDLRYLIKHASHYIVQGSETLKAFAVYLPEIDGQDPRSRLKTIGRPTALVIEAPITEIDCRTIEELDEKMTLLAIRGTHEVCDDGDMIDFTVSFCSGVPPEWIVEHRFIDEATDPDDRARLYRYTE